MGRSNNSNNNNKSKNKKKKSSHNNEKGGSGQKKATAKVAPHAPQISYKKRKAQALTKKQLIQQEKAARKQQRANGNNNNSNNGRLPSYDEAVKYHLYGTSSLFGPINTETMGGGGKKKKDKKKATTGTNNNNNNNSNGGAGSSGKAKSKRNPRHIDIDVDGIPLHYHHNANANNHKNKKTKKRKGPGANFELATFKNSKKCYVPWWQPEHIQAWQQQQSTKQRPKQLRHYLFRTQESKILAWLSQLTAELHAFATYVQVAPSEIAARNYVVDQVQHVSQTSLVCNFYSNNATVKNINNNIIPPSAAADDTEDTVQIHVFGSYATKPVCAFCSDVDMALFGVVPPDPEDTATTATTSRGQHIRFTEQQQELCADKSMDAASDSNNSNDNAKLDLVQKWKDALDEFDRSCSDDDHHQHTHNAEQNDEDDDDDNDDDDDDDAKLPAVNQTPPTNKSRSNSANRGSSSSSKSKRKSPTSSSGGCWQSALDQLLEGANEGPDAVRPPTADDALQNNSIAAAATTTVVVAAAAKVKGTDNDKMVEEVVDLTADSPKSTGDNGQFADANEDGTKRTQNTTTPSSSKGSLGGTKSRDGNPNRGHDHGDDMELPADFFMVDREGIQEKHHEDGDEEANSGKNDDKPKPKQNEQQIDVASRKRPLTTGQDDSQSGSDSEDDTTDKLDSLLARKKRSQRPQRQSSSPSKNPEQVVISLTSSDEDDYDDDDDEDCNDCNEKKHGGWNDMQVSFVSKPGPLLPNKKTIGPTGKTRVKVVNALSSLGNILQRRRYTDKVNVIRKARVPIVKFQTKFGFEGDIAVGGHSGTDTSQFAMSQVQRFQSFAPVVMALKILLWQHNLDTPFTGGLGSYKLYVLVAHHLERHLEMGGADIPGEVFVSFLIRFGKVKRGLGIASSGSSDDIDAQCCCTHLHTQTVLKTRDGYEGDMAAAFLIEHCVDLFQRCYTKLAQRHSSANQPGGTPRSILVDLFDVQKLKTDRNASLERASTLDIYSKSSKNDKSPADGNKRQNGNNFKRRKT